MGQRPRLPPRGGGVPATKSESPAGNGGAEGAGVNALWGGPPVPLCGEPGGDGPLPFSVWQVWLRAR